MKNILQNILFIMTAIILYFCFTNTAVAGSQLSGRILLQVQSHGEAWYVSPVDFKRYFLGRPLDAFNLMKNYGIGITDSDLAKIPIGFISNASTADSDKDGIDDDLEKAIGTDPNKIDTDNDNFNDKIEIDNNYNPNGPGKLYVNSNFTKNSLGKVFLQIEKNGEAWYVNPVDNKRYFLNRPTDAFNVMKKLGLGIANSDLEKIATANTQSIEPSDNPEISAGETVKLIAKLLREKKFEEVLKYIEPTEKNKRVISELEEEGARSLADWLEKSEIVEESSRDDHATFRYYYGENNEYYMELSLSKVTAENIYRIPKGRWIITNW